MFKIRNTICALGIMGILTFILFIVAAQAQEPIDCLVCQNITMTPVFESKDLTILGSDGKGIVIDNTASKFFDSSTCHIIGITKVDKGKASVNWIGKYMAPNGDFYVIEGSSVGTESQWKLIYGTGKFEGITGSGKGERFTNGKPISPGTVQVCSKITGTYELKK